MKIKLILTDDRLTEIETDDINKFIDTWALCMKKRHPLILNGEFKQVFNPDHIIAVEEIKEKSCSTDH